MKNYYKSRQEKGITLIALVITIIVLLILAGVSIMMLTGQNGILKYTKQAKEDYVEGSAMEDLKMAWMNCEMQYMTYTKEFGNVNKSHFFTKEKLNKFISGNNEIMSIKYNEIGNSILKYKVQNQEINISIDSQGNIKKQKWTYIYSREGIPIAVTDGNDTIEIGDYINYDATVKNMEKNPNELREISENFEIEENVEDNKWDIKYTLREGSVWQQYRYIVTDNIPEGNGYGDRTYSNNSKNNSLDIKWKLLGIDEESGELLITTNNALKDIQDQTFGIRGCIGTKNGVNELNNISKIYGYGYGASVKTNSRSIVFNDINNLTLFRPEYSSYKFKYEDNGDVYYSKNGAEYEKLSQNYSSRGFNYLQTNENGNIVSWGNLKNSTEKEITLIAAEESGNTASACNDFSNKYPKLMDMVLTEDGESYWLANADFRNDTMTFGIMLEECGGAEVNIWTTPAYYTDAGVWDSWMYCVRPVVALDENINLSVDNSNDNTWNISI